MANLLQSLLGSGQVQNAAKVMQDRAYQIHVQEAKSLGEKPLTPEEWARQNSK